MRLSTVTGLASAAITAYLVNDLGIDLIAANVDAMAGWACIASNGLLTGFITRILPRIAQ